MVLSALTCDGCGGRNLKACERTEEEMTIRIIGKNRRQVRLPLPMLCLDCGSASSSFRPVTQRERSD